MFFFSFGVFTDKALKFIGNGVWEDIEGKQQSAEASISSPNSPYQVTVKHLV